MPLRKARDNKWVFTFQVVTPTDTHIYTITYKSLAEAEEKMQADHDEVTALGQVASGIKVAHAAMASADPTIHEYCTHLSAQKKRILVSLITKRDGPLTNDTFTRSEHPVTCVDDLAEVHAQHRAKRMAHGSQITTDAVTLDRLQTIGTVPPIHTVPAN